MLKKLGFVEFIKAVMDRVEEGTEYRCYDAIPKNAPSPFYFAEIVGLRPENTKTMYVDVFTVFIHVIADPQPNNSSVKLYQMIQGLEEAMTKDIDIDCQYTLIKQTSSGLQTIQTDETKEKHGVLGYEFNIAYGFKTK